jgi:quercetin dioxygenase-like cupin family protein
MTYQDQVDRLTQAAWRCSLLISLSIAGASAHAQAPDQEPALSSTADDAQLKWGPCPPFLPEGCGIAVLHGDPAKDNADVFLRVPGKSSLPLHWHTSAERMVLVAGELHVTYEGQQPAILKPGTYAYGPAKRPHEGYCASAAPCILFIAFELPVDAVPMASEPQ